MTSSATSKSSSGPKKMRKSSIVFIQTDDINMKIQQPTEKGNNNGEKSIEINEEKSSRSSSKFTCKQKLSLASLATIDFMSACTMSIMAPFFPSEASKIGMSETLSGFFFSFSALVMFISSPFFGKFLPKVGEKFMLMCGLTTSGVCYIAFGALDYIQNYTIFTILCFTIQGFIALGTSAYFTASFVFVVKIFPDNAATVRGTMETFVGLGMSVGPAIGAFLYSYGGFCLPFYVFGLLGLILTPINLYLLPTPKYEAEETKSGSIKELLKVPGVIVTACITILISVTWAFLDPTLEPHLTKYGFGAETVGLLFLLLAASYGIASPICGWIADKINNHWSMMAVGLFVNCVALLLLGPSPIIPFVQGSIWTIVAGLTIVGISVASATIPSYDGIVIHATNAGFEDNLATQSLVAGLWSSAYSLGEVIGPLAGGVLLEYWGFPLGATLLAAVNLLLVIVCIVFYGFVLKPKVPTVVQSDSEPTSTLRIYSLSIDSELGDAKRF